MSSTTYRVITTTGRVHVTQSQTPASLLESERTGRIHAACGLTVVMGRFTLTDTAPVSCGRCARIADVDVSPVHHRADVVRRDHHRAALAALTAAHAADVAAGATTPVGQILTALDDVDAADASVWDAGRGETIPTGGTGALQH